MERILNKQELKQIERNGAIEMEEYSKKSILEIIIERRSKS